MLVAVCDYDRTITDYIKLLIDTEFRDIIQTKIYDSASDLESSILKNEIPDAIIIDICIKNENGLEMLKRVREHIPTTPVIFITGYLEYCSDIFIDFNPWGLITKPIDKNKLCYHINKILKYYNFNKPLSIKISVNRQNIIIDKSKILYLESHERKVTYYTAADKYEEYIKLDNAMIKLDNSFLRCHKSYAVNLTYAVDLLKYKIVMSDGTKVPVSRNYYDNVKKMIFKHKASKIGL